MLEVAPIPYWLLPHTVTVSDEVLSKWGTAPADKSTTVKNVRVEPYATYGLQGQENTAEDLQAVMFVDAVNSLPIDVAYKLGQYVVFDGITYRIKSIDRVYAIGLHHLEIGLI